MPEKTGKYCVSWFVEVLAKVSNRLCSSLYSSCRPASAPLQALVTVTGIAVMVYSCEQYLSSLGQSSRKLISSFRVVFSLTLTNGISAWSLPFWIVSCYLSICCLAWDPGHF